MDKLTITQPDDWHLHVRNGDILRTVIAHSANQFGRAIIMPNLVIPVTTVEKALDYRHEILTALLPDNSFNPLMTLYLTDQTTAEEVYKVAECEHVYAFKLYPAGVTTHSSSGITRLDRLFPILAAMEKNDVPLLIHGEVTDEKYDIFDREKIFIAQNISRITERFPELRIVIEHLTTQESVQFVEAASDKVAATITPQHLLFNRNALLVSGLHPHYYCLPILKREHHRRALVNAAVSGNAKFFLGTDSAPHLTHLKENACGCAGCYSAYAAIELYMEVFEQENALDRLEGFASFFGADFYHLPRNTKTITLQKQSWQVPEHFFQDKVRITPLKAGGQLSWKLVR